MSWPALKAPATFDFVGVVGTVVEMVAHPIVSEGAAAAVGHDFGDFGVRSGSEWS